MGQNTTQTSIVDTAKYGTCQSNNMTFSRGVSKIVGTRAWFFSSSKTLMRNYVLHMVCYNVTEYNGFSNEYEVCWFHLQVSSRNPTKWALPCILRYWNRTWEEDVSQFVDITHYFGYFVTIVTKYMFFLYLFIIVGNIQIDKHINMFLWYNFDTR